MGAQEDAEEILSDCFAGRTLQVARIVASHYEQALSDCGVTPHQLTLLSMICKMGAPSASEMLPFLNMDQSTLSRNLERMVARDWLKHVSSENDARVKRYSLTNLGESTLVSSHGAWKEAQSWARSALGQKHCDDIKDIAHRLNPLLPGRS